MEAGAPVLVLEEGHGWWRHQDDGDWGDLNDCHKITYESSSQVVTTGRVAPGAVRLNLSPEMAIQLSAWTLRARE
jgi:hypothetical protein